MIRRLSNQSQAKAARVGDPKSLEKREAGIIRLALFGACSVRLTLVYLAEGFRAASHALVNSAFNRTTQRDEFGVLIGAAITNSLP